MIVMRHCQSVFNLHFERTGRDPGVQDPPLTPFGVEQAERAASALARDGARIERLLASPFRRALQTAAPVARRFGLAVELAPVARERRAFSCDIGSAPDALRRDWPALDLSALSERWWMGGDPDGVAESEESARDRAERFRVAMATDPDQEHTLLVSHWGFLLALTGRSLPNGAVLRFEP